MATAVAGVAKVKKAKKLATDVATEASGKKRKAVAPKASEEVGAEASGKKRKAVGPKATEGVGAEKKEKQKKVLTPKKLKRREITTIYGDLINPGREVKAEVLVENILALLAKRSSPLQQYCGSEVGSRVVQACLKWGTREQRNQLLGRLKDQLPKMAVDRYGCMVVMKLLRYCTRTATERKPTAEEKAMREKNARDILEAFRGKGLRTAFFHKYGCRVVNSIYFSDFASAKEKRRLLHEVALPQALTLTKAELVTAKPLRQLLATVAAEDRASILAHLAEQVDRCVEKQLLACDIVHLLFQAHCEVATESQLRDLTSRCMAGAPNLLSSKPGAEAAVRMLGVANAKERKAFCKDLKGKFVALTSNSVDYVVMMRLLSTVDDTVMLEKTVLAEWQADLESVCFDKYGAKVVAWLLSPGDTHIFSPYERQCLDLPAPSSVKAADKRRQELMRALRPSLLAVLQANALRAASDVHAKDLLLAYMASDWSPAIVEALITAAEADAAASEGLGMLDNGTVVSTLIALLKLAPTAATSLADPLWRRCLEPRLTQAAAGRPAFVMRALLRAGGMMSNIVRTELDKQRPALEAAAKAAEKKSEATSGLRSLLDALDGKEGKASHD